MTVLGHDAVQREGTMGTPNEDPSHQLQFGQSPPPSLSHSGVSVMSRSQNTHANAVAVGYRHFSHGGNARPLHYVHVWMLAQRAQGEGYPTEDYLWMARHAGPWGWTSYQHTQPFKQHIDELLRERILRDLESKGSSANFSAVVNHLTSLACVRHETRNGIAFPMHTQIGDEGQQVAHTLVIINTGMRTVPGRSTDTPRQGPAFGKEQRGLGGGPALAGRSQVRRLCLLWLGAGGGLAFVRKLDSTTAYQQRAGTQAATSAASLLSFLKNRLVEFRGRYPVSGAILGTPRAQLMAESQHTPYPDFLGSTPSPSDRGVAASTTPDLSDSSKYERLLNKFPKRQDKEMSLAS
eukprot:470770-Pleurochrysis_carterae.AAC.2